MAAVDRFDKEAAEWDNNPFTVKSSQFALGALLENVPQLQATAGEISKCRLFLTGLLLEPCGFDSELMPSGYGNALFHGVAVCKSVFRKSRLRGGPRTVLQTILDKARCRLNGLPFTAEALAGVSMGALPSSEM